MIPLTCTSVALTVICDSVTLEFPVLLTVTLFELELPAFRLPKDKLMGLAVTVTVFATPVPLRETRRRRAGCIAYDGDGGSESSSSRWGELNCKC